MKNVIIANIINFVILFIIVFMMFLHFPKLLVYGLLVVWFVLVIYQNYSLLMKSNESDIIYELKKANKKGVFDERVNAIITYYKAIEFKRDFFESYEEDSSIRASYELLSRQMTSNIISLTKYLRSYDYVSRPFTSYVMNIARDCKELVDKLNELSELVVKIDDSTSNVDITYVDDMLESLRKVVKDEKI